MPDKKDGSQWWIYNQIHDNAHKCAGFLEQMLNTNSKFQINVFLLVCKKDINEILQATEPFNFKVKYGSSNNNKSIFSIQLAKNDEINKKTFGNVLFVRTSAKEVYLAVTDESRIFVESVLRPFIRSYYPDISRAFLSASELQQILELLENTTGGEIIVDRITAYRRISSKLQKYSRKEKRKDTEAAVTYTSVPYKEAFNDAIARDQWIDKIRFELAVDSKLKMEAYFSRQGLFKFKRSFYPFYQTLLPFIIEIIEKKFKLYSNRSRDITKSKPLPLVIDLDYDVFSDIAQNHRFIESLKKMPYASASVYHANPYVHLSLVDYLDGSSFDIWVLSSNRITVVPQLRASEASVARLMNHIFERFREGDIKEYERYVKAK